MLPKEPFLKTADVARLLNTSPSNVTRLVKSGMLRAFRLGKGVNSEWRFDRGQLAEDLEKLQRKF